MWRIAAEAQQMLAERFGVAADTWAVTSWGRLRTEALEIERWNRLHPQVSRFVDRSYTSLGTDGFGRSDARDALRSHFEVNAQHLVVAVLHSLAEMGGIERSVVSKAIDDLGIDPERASSFSL
jgi:pyruvate dehydrogenase E1 component